MAALDKFREKYPQYNELSDIDVATRLAKKYPSYGGLLEKVKTEQIGQLDKQYAETVTSTPEELEQFSKLRKEHVAQPQDNTPEEIAQFRKLLKEHDIKPNITESHPGMQVARTLENIGQVIPALEAAGQMVTGMGAQAVGGATGLARTAAGLVSGQGLDKSLQAGSKVIEGITKHGTYQPHYQRGQELSQSAAYPFTKLQEGADIVAEKALAAGHPNLAASIASAPGVVGTLAGVKMGVPKNPVTALAKNALATKNAVTKAMNEAIKPKFKSKKTATKVKEYENKSLTAIEGIVRRKDTLELPDKLESGRTEKRLPDSVKDFQEAISQTKEKVFTEFTESAEAAGRKGIRVDTEDAARALNEIVNDKVTGNFTPKTVEWAIERQNMLERMSNAGSLGTKPGGMTPLETQQAIKQLNINIQAYERAPSAANYSTAMVDALVVNNLRKSLDDAIQSTKGKDYQALKNEYSALKTIEDDVNKMANVERNKAAGMLLPDFTDIIAGHQITSGLISGSPATLAGGAFVKAMSLARKTMKDPNRKIKNMFKTVDKNLTEQAILKAKIAERRK